MSGASWLDFYDDTFADVVLAETADPSIDAACDFLVDALQLQPGQRVLDQGCGTGRIALPLARRGFRVVGVDAQASYVERARTAAGKLGLALELHAADARTLKLAQPCAAAFSWATSFGHAHSDEENLELLQAAFAALEAGGRFALDWPNLAGVLRAFKPVMEARYPAGLVTRHSRLDLARGLLEQRWVYTLPDGARHERSGATRLYLPHQLIDLATSAGFVEPRLVGDVHGAPLGLDSPRCILLARRPA